MPAAFFPTAEAALRAWKQSSEAARARAKQVR